MDFLRENKALRFILALAVFALCLWLVVSGQQLTGTPGGLLRMLAGLAGLAYASIYSTILPGGGGGFELDAIAGVVIGGTSMSGGYGTISGTLIGVFIMSVLKTGLPFVGLQSNWQQAVTGVVLVFAVFMDVMNRQKKKKA